MATIKSVERDLTLAIPFNDVLGCCCPKCNSVAVGLKLKANMHYCPYCGQHLKMVNVNNGDWAALIKDVNKIPNVMDTEIVIKGVDLSEGPLVHKWAIEGVYMERFKAYNNEHAQIEGQLSLF